MQKQVKELLQLHASLIQAVVTSCQSGDSEELSEVLNAAEANGWSSLSNAIREVLAGERDMAHFASLDAEDQLIVQAILEGLASPNSLPKDDALHSPLQAPKNFAALIHAAQHDDEQAKQLLSTLCRDMLNAGGDMAQLSMSLQFIYKGESQLSALTANCSVKTAELLHAIVNELEQLQKSTA